MLTGWQVHPVSLFPLILIFRFVALVFFRTAHFVQCHVAFSLLLCFLNSVVVVFFIYSKHIRRIV